MRLKITHTTTYHYDRPLRYGLQRIRLEPHDDYGQRIQSWALEIEGADEQLQLTDHFENKVRLLAVNDTVDKIVIRATGLVETIDNAGVWGRHRGFVPLWLFQRHTSLTRPGQGIRSLLSHLPEVPELEKLHKLLELVAARVAYETGQTDTRTTAESALAAGSGVCQDHTHIFIAAARALGHPARYISGYLKMDDQVDQVAGHAWAEVHIEDLGWVGFDVSNGISPDERYVRVAIGRDYSDAIPVSGIRVGHASETLDVHIAVEQ